MMLIHIEVWWSRWWHNHHIYSIVFGAPQFLSDSDKFGEILCIGHACCMEWWLFSGSDTDFHGFVTKSIQFMSHCNVIDSRVGYNNYLWMGSIFHLISGAPTSMVFIIPPNAFTRLNGLKAITNWKWSCCELWTRNTVHCFELFDHYLVHSHFKCSLSLSLFVICTHTHP